MRTMLVVALLIILMVLGGWLAFSNSGGSAKVEFKTDAAKKDVENAIEGTRDFIKGVVEDKTPASPAPSL